MMRVTVGNKGEKTYTVVIEDNVPLPAKAERAKSTERVYAYPFLSMKPGQSYVVDDKDTAERVKRGGYQRPYFALTRIAEITEGENKGKWRVWYVGPRVTKEEVDAEMAANAPAQDAAALLRAEKAAKEAVSKG
jgi:hypothetical protein